MAKKLNFTLVMIITIIFSLCLHAGELTFGWNKINESGNIRDMEFMPDNDYFILSTVKDIQIRRTETGELVSTYPIPAVQLEFTPDSTKLISIYGDRLEIRNLNDMSLIRQHIIPTGTDTEGLDIVESGIRFNELVVDPVRPYIYVIRQRSGTLNGNIYLDIRKIVIYNYETMEEVGIMPNSNGDNLWLQRIAISKDGKYLAVNNGGASYLRVWDLGTRQEIRSYKLCDYIPGSGDDGQPSCTKFSEINSDIIYFSGKFPKKGSGIFIYNISENKIIDSTFAIAPNYVMQGYFTLLDNEERAIKLKNWDIYILNFKNKTIEQKIKQDTIAIGPANWGDKILYSIQKGYIIGFSAQYYTFGSYVNSTSIEDPIHYDSIIYPNPSSGVIIIESNCQNPVQTYEVLDITGSVLIPVSRISTQTGIIQIDISYLPAGTYFLRYYCGSSLTTYKVIKED